MKAVHFRYQCITIANVAERSWGAMRSRYRGNTQTTQYSNKWNTKTMNGSYDTPLRHFGKTGLLAFLMLGHLAFSSHAHAEIKDENLIQAFPTGFMIAHQDGNSRASLTEMIADGDSLQDWAEMVTTQIYYGASNASFDTYQNEMQNRWKNACDTTQFSFIKEGTDNGYPFQLWQQACRYKDKDRKPEITWFKMIQGRDSAYIVQVAMHSEPSKAKTKQWLSYLDKVVVCDSRHPGQECNLTMLQKP